jgi:Ice-binding-like
MNSLKDRQKYLAMCLLATAALIGGVSSASAQAPALGAVANFAVLGGKSVTCTGGAVVGEVGISPGITASYTNTGCAVAGATPPASNPAAVQAHADFLTAYDALAVKAASYACTQLTGSLAGEILAPGEYCLDTAAKTGLLTLKGPRAASGFSSPMAHSRAPTSPWSWPAEGSHATCSGRQARPQP